MTDKTTKFTLIAIAMGLWANLFSPVLLPKAAHADDNSDTILYGIASDISDMASDIHRIEIGTCSNSKLCD